MGVHSAHSGSEYIFMRSSIWILIVCLLSGCDFRKEAHLTPSTQEEEVPLTIFAAASLTDAFSEIAGAFETAHPGVIVNLHFAGSQQLAQQIYHGAPADIFASANEAQMQVAIASWANRCQSPKKICAQSVGCCFTARKPAELKNLHDLARPELLLVIADEVVPIGYYSKILLERVSQEVGSSYVNSVLNNVASYEQNVRAVLTKVALGEADAGIVYASDLVGIDTVTPLKIPSHLNAQVSYPIAPLLDSKYPDLSQAFTVFVHSSESRRILAKYGFLYEAAI